MAEQSLVSDLTRRVQELRERCADLEKQLDAQARHDALGEGETCPVCDEMNWEQLNKDLDEVYAENKALRAERDALQTRLDEIHAGMRIVASSHRKTTPTT